MLMIQLGIIEHPTLRSQMNKGLDKKKTLTYKNPQLFIRFPKTSGTSVLERKVNACLYAEK